jgi:predicted Zn-dependent peptidase
LNSQLAHRFHLSNGIRLLVAENPHVDIVAARFFFAGGSRTEPTELAGLANLVAAVLTKGSYTRDAHTIAAAVESLGISLGSDSTPDYFDVGLKCVTADLEEALALTAEIICTPSFPAREVERERDMVLQAIRAQQERPFHLAFEQVRMALYGPHHPYATSVQGNLKSVSRLQRAHLLDYHARYLRPEQLVISLVSPQSPEKLVKFLSQRFEAWTPEPVECLSVEQADFPQLRPQLHKHYQPTHQSIVMVGFRGVAVSHPDYPVLKLLSTYLGNGLSSRLFVELREKQGLAYEVSAFFATRHDPAPFVAYLGTAPENTGLALQGLTAELERIQDHALTEAELNRAKRKLLGQYALGKQTNAQVAQLMGWYECLGLGMEFDQRYPNLIQSVCSEDIIRVARSYLTAPIISLVGPEEVLQSF